MSNVNYVVRDNTTGAIIKTGYCLESNVQNQAKAGQTAEVDTIGVLDATHYYDGTNYVERDVMGLSVDKTNILADNTEIATVSNIPAGTVIDGVTVDDGVLEFTTNEIASHELRFENEPQYLPETIEIEAVAP